MNYSALLQIIGGMKRMSTYKLLFPLGNNKKHTVVLCLHSLFLHLPKGKMKKVTYKHTTNACKHSLYAFVD